MRVCVWLFINFLSKMKQLIFKAKVILQRSLMYTESDFQLEVVDSGTLWKIILFLQYSLSSYSLTMSISIEHEESDTTLYGCIEDNVVVVSLMFFRNSFPDEQRLSILGDKSEIGLHTFSNSRVRDEFFLYFNDNGT